MKYLGKVSCTYCNKTIEGHEPRYITTHRPFYFIHIGCRVSAQVGLKLIA